MLIPLSILALAFDPSLYANESFIQIVRMTRPLEYYFNNSFWREKI